MKRLGDLVDVLGGGTPSKARPDYWEGTIPWVSPKDMKVDEIRDAQDHIGEDALRESACKLIPVDSVLFVVRGMILAHTLPVAITRVPVAINQDMKALVPRPGLLPEYLFWALRAASGNLLERCEIAGHGTRRLASEHWETLVFPLPPLDEQRRISVKMQTVMERLAEVEAVARESTSLYDASLRDLFGRIRGTERHANLASVSEVRGGQSLPVGSSGISNPSMTLLVKVGDMNLDGNEEFVSTARESIASFDSLKVFGPGTVILPKRGGAIATNKKRILGRPALLDPNLMGLVPDRTVLDPEFLLAFMESVDLSKLSNGGVIPQLNKKDLAPLQIPLPSLEAQKKIVHSISSLRHCVASVRLAQTELMAEIDLLRSAILRRAFAGQL